MSHDLDSLIWRYLDDELDEVERAAFEARLASDDDLLARVEGARRLHEGFLAALVTPLGDDQRRRIWSSFDRVVRDREQAEAAPAGRRLAFPRFVLPAFGSAAAIVLALWLGGLFSPRPAAEPSSPPAETRQASWYANSPVIEAVVVADRGLRRRIDTRSGKVSWDDALRRALSDEPTYTIYLGSDAAGRAERVAELRRMMVGCSIAPFDPATFPDSLELDGMRVYEARVESVEYVLRIPQFMLSEGDAKLSVHVLCSYLAQEILTLVGCLEPDCKLAEGQPTRPLPIDDGHVVVISREPHILLLVADLPADDLAAIADRF